VWCINILINIKLTNVLGSRQFDYCIIWYVAHHFGWFSLLFSWTNNVLFWFWIYVVLSSLVVLAYVRRCFSLRLFLFSIQQTRPTTLWFKCHSAWHSIEWTWFMCWHLVWQGSFRLHLRHWSPRLCCYVCTVKPDESCWRISLMYSQCAWLLPPADGLPLRILCRRLIAVSSLNTCFQWFIVWSLLLVWVNSDGVGGGGFIGNWLSQLLWICQQAFGWTGCHYSRLCSAELCRSKLQFFNVQLGAGGNIARTVQ